MLSNVDPKGFLDSPTWGFEPKPSPTNGRKRRQEAADRRQRRVGGSVQEVRDRRPDPPLLRILWLLAIDRSVVKEGFIDSPIWGFEPKPSPTNGRKRRQEAADRRQRRVGGSVQEVRDRRPNPPCSEYYTL